MSNTLPDLNVDDLLQVIMELTLENKKLKKRVVELSPPAQTETQ